ncbi:2'-5' RNA ligase family protein [bacterium]|nr:2'-5' RNA ligase family protein [bacterium]
MHLKALYDTMWKDAHARFERGDFELDQHINSSLDTRRGLTLLARPPAYILDSLQELLTTLSPVVEGQYSYPRSDIHMTILSIISCYAGFCEEVVPLEEYCRLIRNSVEHVPPFEVTFTGLTASPSCLMVRGYPSGEGLTVLRDRLRETFLESELEQSIDSRYRIETAHLTILRFARSVARPKEFLDLLRETSTIEIGRCKIDNVEFVANDWYQRQANTRLIERFQLGGRDS